MLHLTVMDFGIGIPESVRSLPQNASLTSADALVWAFQQGTTTKNNGVSRGLGLNLLQEFVAANQGSLMICSNDGYVAISDHGIDIEDKHVNFAGTRVDIAFQCDERYYCLASEVPSTDEPLF